MPAYSATLKVPDEAAARAVADALEERIGAEAAVSWFEDAAGWTASASWDGERKDLAAAVRAVAKAHGVEAEIGPLPDIDWVAKSLAGLPPIRAGRFVVHGGHDRGKTLANDIAIEIEASQAFGTGHHGTTAGCLELLDDLRKSQNVRAALDLGTGSGVLAIAIAKAWRIPVLASDIDPLAVRIAAENARINCIGWPVQTVVAAGFRHKHLRAGRFDLIVANILAGPLAALAPELAGHLLPGGRVILSGLLPHQRTRIVAAYRGQGLRLRRSIIRNGWLSLLLALPG